MEDRMLAFAEAACGLQGSSYIHSVLSEAGTILQGSSYIPIGHPQTVLRNIPGSLPVLRAFATGQSSTRDKTILQRRKIVRPHN